MKRASSATCESQPARPGPSSRIWSLGGRVRRVLDAHRDGVFENFTEASASRSLLVGRRRSRLGQGQVVALARDCSTATYFGRSSSIVTLCRSSASDCPGALSKPIGKAAFHAKPEFQRFQPNAVLGGVGSWFSSTPLALETGRLAVTLEVVGAPRCR